MSRARRGRAVAALAVAVVAVACDVRDVLPPTPADASRAADVARADRLRAHLAALPAVTGASVIIERTAVDPLARVLVAAPPTIAIALVAHPEVEVGRLEAVTRTAAEVVVGRDARVAIAIVPALDRPALARLGPFTVAAAARGPLLALIAGALLVIAALAIALTVVLARRADRS